MRPVRLTINGLACFKDEVEIDLKALDLFAIWGPTGAGKSTILDAMIFALYGEVPRVNSRNRTQMISASRDRASVVFDFNVGQDRFRIARTLRRSGSHDVQLEKHDGNDFTINVAGQVKEAEEKIVEILGLDATAFMQAVILPQGEFASFLQAAPRERRNMLRTLLRLDVYERMREKAQQIATNRKSKVESLRSVLDNEYAGVNDASLSSLESLHKTASEELGALQIVKNESQGRLDDLKIQHGKTSELLKYEAQHGELQGRAHEIQTARVRLEASRRAAPVMSYINEATLAKKEAKDAESQLATANKECKEATAQLNEKKKGLAAAETAAAAIPDIRERIGRLNQVVGRMPALRKLEKSIAETAAEMKKLEQDLAKLVTRLAEARESKANHSKELTKAQATINSIQYDAELEALLDGVREQAFELGSQRKQLAEQKKELSGVKKSHSKLSAGIDPLKREAERAQKELDSTKAQARKREEALHKAQQLDAANHLRHDLKAGEQCPVCEQTVPSPPRANLKPEVAEALSALETARGLLSEAERTSNDAQQKLSIANGNLSAEKTKLDELQTKYSTLQATVTDTDASLHETLGDHLADVDVGVDVEVWVSAKAALFREYRKSYDKVKDDLLKLERAIEKEANKEETAQEALSEKEASKQSLGEKLKTLNAELTSLQDEIAAVTQSQDPAAEVNELNDQIEALETSVTSARSDCANSEKRFSSAENGVKLRTDTAAKAREKVVGRIKRRDEEVRGAGFDSEDQAKAALLDAATETKLEKQLQAYDRDLHLVEQQIAAISEELGTLRVSADEVAAAETLTKDVNAQVDKKQGEQKAFQAQVGQMKQRIKRSTEMRAELESEEKLLRTHDQLASDLRSDKFQAFILEDAFTKLVAGASTRLSWLTGERYSLRFQDDNILVVDNDNAGETRISSTLSGGETFLASLSLALQLSSEVQEASGAVNLDSLFIDEGFGTLDADTLSVVAETIQSLQAGGRMVGIITHLRDLRDEFEQQIIVHKHQGYSTIEVTGVSDGKGVRAVVL